MNLYNIGGEGQLYLGLIGGAWAGIALGDHLPTLLMVPVVLLCGALAGAAWIFVPAFVRSRLGTSEIVSTLLLTYIGASLIKHVIYTPGSFFRNPNTSFLKVDWSQTLRRSTASVVHGSIQHFFSADYCCCVVLGCQAH